ASVAGCAVAARRWGWRDGERVPVAADGRIPGGPDRWRRGRGRVEGCLMLPVRVGNVGFRGVTESGLLTGPDGFKGWEGSSATKRGVVERPGRHGAFPAPAFKSARLVQLSGHALAASVAELEHMGEVLAGVGQGSQTITVTTEAGTRWGVGSVE